MKNDRGAGAVIRFILTLPFTLIGVVWSLAWGAHPRLGPTLMVECGGMRGGFARGGITIGSAWLFGDLCDEGRRRHETVHALQWAVFGPLLPPLYWLAELAGRQEKNLFERWAGIGDGGYGQGGRAPGTP